ncbi:MAG: hypothetical protein AAF204_00050 [Pseudomonadota bacterium]
MSEIFRGIFQGPKAGDQHLYVWSDGKNIASSTSLSHVLNEMRSYGAALEIDPQSISFMLNNALVPPPNTIYKDVYMLGIGQSIRFEESAGGAQKSVFEHKFPFEEKQSTGQSKPSTDILLEKLCASLSRRVSGESALMLSSGKDSVALALASKECGISPTCFTYADAQGAKNDETQDAKHFAQKLGLKHETIKIPDDPQSFKAGLLHYFENTASPSGDPTTAAYFLGLHNAGIKNTAIIDGTRNDIYMGIVPTQKYELLGEYYRILGGALHQNWPPFHSKISKFLSSFPEVHLYKHGQFRFKETQKFYEPALPTARFWKDTYNQYKDLDDHDLRGLFIGQIFDGCGVTLKGEMVAEALESDLIMPWADEELADYFFNLPCEYKYDYKTRTNKILLREMLKEKCGYEAGAIGKRVFYFNSKRFVLNNKNFVQDEILSCDLWNANIETYLTELLGKLEHEPRLGGALYGLFMLSGWYNHSKYLK